MNLSTRDSSSSPPIHEARAALAGRLRTLRRQAGLTGTQLAESLSWPQSKVSKLETARQIPSERDLRVWTQATDSEPLAEELICALQTLEAQHAEWLRVLRPGLKPHQRKLSELDAQTRLFRMFESTVIPGLLQTSEYAKRRLAQGIILFNAPNDLSEAVRARMQRQEILYRGDKLFHFIIPESALRLRLCEARIMLPQLDRLMSLSTLPNVRLGIIDSDTQYVVGPWHGFSLRDNERVLIETYSAELNLVQSKEIELYGRIFGQLAGLAKYGGSARAIVAAAAEDLANQDSPEES